jgi:NAD(P)-dependent dehydrogenase (short-subunit alcohol dehydrogenase family)
MRTSHLAGLDKCLIIAVGDVRPQILVNNAGGGGHIPPHFPEARREDWQRIITLNLLAPIWATQEALVGCW